MRLTVINGSPRHRKSNTGVFLDNFLTGFQAGGGEVASSHFIYPSTSKDELVGAFTGADVLLLGFPLYVDAMPSGVMSFFEALKPLCGREGNPGLLFMVQSGFPEAFHSRFVERYLEKLASRLGCQYHGTIVKGGGEGIREMPPRMTRKVLIRMQQLGEDFARTGRLDADILRQIAGAERFGPLRRLVARTIMFPMVNRIYWNKILKQNNALERVWERPYAEE